MSRRSSGSRAEMPVDILAHPTLVALPFRGDHVDALWTEERESRLVDALFAAGIAFEISSRYAPHERLVRRAVERGVRISLGSDGHTARAGRRTSWRRSRWRDRSACPTRICTIRSVTGRRRSASANTPA